MTVVLTEDFTGTNGDPLPAGNWSSQDDAQGGSNAPSIQSNRGEWEGQAGFAWNARAIVDMASVEHLEVTGDVWTKADRDLYVWLRHDGTWLSNPNEGEPSDGYGFRIRDNEGLTIIKRTGGTGSTLATDATALTNGTQYSFRLQTNGTLIRGRIWETSGSEPSTWDLSVSDSDVASGVVAVSMFAAGSGTPAGEGSQLDDLTITNLTPISQVGTTQEGGASNGGDVTLTFDGTLAQDDVVLVFGSSRGTHDSTPTGYTKIATVPSTTPAVTMTVAYKVMGATPDTDVVVPGDGAGPTGSTAISIVLRGVDTTNVEDAVETLATGTGPDPDAPSITTVTDGAWVFSASVTGINEADAPPAGYWGMATIEQLDSERTVTSIAQKIVEAAGVEDPGTWDHNFFVEYGIVTLAIRPAGGGGGGTPVTLYATGDGTIASVVNELDTTTNLYQSIDDDPSSPNDSDWINNTADPASYFTDLTNMPVDFATMDTLSVDFRIRTQEYSSPITLYAQVFEADEITPLTDEMTIDTASGDTAFSTFASVTFTGLNTSASKSTWDGAKLRVRWD